jgi:hypothetical protein
MLNGILIPLNGRLELMNLAESELLATTDSEVIVDEIDEDIL